MQSERLKRTGPADSKMMLARRQQKMIAQTAALMLLFQWVTSMPAACTCPALASPAEAPSCCHERAQTPSCCSAQKACRQDAEDDGVAAASQSPGCKSSSACQCGCQHQRQPLSSRHGNNRCRGDMETHDIAVEVPGALCSDLVTGSSHGHEAGAGRPKALSWQPLYCIWLI